MAAGPIGGRAEPQFAGVQPKPMGQLESLSPFDVLAGAPPEASQEVKRPPIALLRPHSPGKQFQLLGAHIAAGAIRATLLPQQQQSLQPSQKQSEWKEGATHYHPGAGAEAQSMLPLRDAFQALLQGKEIPPVPVHQTPADLKAVGAALSQTKGVREDALKMKLDKLVAEYKGKLEKATTADERAQIEAYYNKEMATLRNVFEKTNNPKFPDSPPGSRPPSPTKR